ncbi:NfeD family protein [Cohnella nanjingensis]|uniref:Protease n=1 Tax=Cohnella nanjingensis TaxID=1387779 RepID=A0A7X0RPK9_9BACL|nr:NfeD family protein [Cohnella nanjingensis]MBB6671128.1 protease [Cohnella nanjingensis]
MEALFWCCLGFGALMAIVTLVFGDLLGGATGWFEWLSIDGHHLFQPVVLAGGITVFGGAGLLMHRYSPLSALGVYASAIVIAVAIAIAMYFVYVRPMKASENSVGFSMNDLEGKRAEVLTSIPADGCGEVLVKIGAGLTNQIAESFDKEDVPSGTEVVIVRVRGEVVYVSRLD